MAPRSKKSKSQKWSEEQKFLLRIAHWRPDEAVKFCRWFLADRKTEAVLMVCLGPYPDKNPNIIYTVTYRRGEGKKPEGTLVEGESVKVKDGMIFDVTRTDKS